MIQMFDLWFLLNELETERNGMEWNETKLNESPNVEEQMNSSNRAKGKHRKWFSLFPANSPQLPLCLNGVY